VAKIRGPTVAAVRAAGFAKLSYGAVLTAEQFDAIFLKYPNERGPQNE
jgi:hypothetical protein